MKKAISEYVFESVSLNIIFDEYSNIKEYSPQVEYDNINNLKLNKNGHGLFCKFSIGSKWSGKSGVYIFYIDDELVYIGQCENFLQRLNMGYGRISPRNCYEGGQSTNCKINKVILESIKQNSRIEIFFLETDQFDSIERKLISIYKPKYNVQLNSRDKVLKNKKHTNKLKDNSKDRIERSCSMSTKNKSTKEIREYIQYLKREERKRGCKELILVASDIHNDLELSRCYPSVCNAMYSQMGQEDTVLHKTPSGLSSTIKIKYTL